MVRNILIISFFIFSIPALAGEDCTCSHKGAKTPEGQQACIRTPKGMQMAECSRVLNNTSWKFLGTPCPTASIDIDTNQSNFDFDKSKKLLDKLG